MRITTRIAITGAMAFIVASLVGCTTAGPFITNISSDGKGNLIVEKNTVHMNAFMGTVSSGSTPTTSVIRVLPDPQEK